MVQHLIVIKPFLRYVRGDIIIDPDEVGEVLATEHSRFVTRIIAPNRSKG